MRWTKDEIIFLIENYKCNGAAYCQQKLGRSKRAMAHIWDKHHKVNNEDNNKNVWNENEIEFLKTFYAKKGGKFCAKSLKRSIYSIRGKAAKLNLKVSTDMLKQYADELKNMFKVENYEKYCKINIEEKLYRCIDTPEMSYFFGLFWADGHVRNNKKGANEIIIHNLKNDIDIFFKIFGSFGKWKLQKPKQAFLHGKPCGIMQVMSIVDLKFKNFLVEHNAHIKSSGISPTSLINLIPENLKKYFYRGFLDGDGNVYSSLKHNKIKVAFTSTYEQDWRFLTDKFNEFNITYKIYKRIYKNGKRSTLNICGYKNCEMFLNYLYEGYENDQIGLLRKYTNFKNFINEKYK
jgi:hypothetical protein